MRDPQKDGAEGFDPSRIERLMQRATPLPWAWEQCGDKCDDPVIGVAWHIEDETCTPVPGFLEDFDANGNVVEYYRESIAYLGDANSPDSSASANAMLIVEAINALPTLLALAAQAQSQTPSRLENNAYSALACGGTHEESVANAALIAAAPSLYECLNDAMQWPSIRAALGKDLTARAHAALAKARGETVNG